VVRGEPGVEANIALWYSNSDTSCEITGSVDPVLRALPVIAELVANHPLQVG
jgi:hypothetical protein